MLDPSAEEIRDWGNSVVEFMANYLGDLRDRPVYRRMCSREIGGRLERAMPIKGIDFNDLLKVFRETIVPFSRQNAHPRMFGYVQSPGTPLAAFADLLASTLIWLTPNELDDVMSWSAGICPKFRSSGAVTSDAITSGLAPGSCVVTWMVGKSTCGSDETGSQR